MARPKKNTYRVVTTGEGLLGLSAIRRSPEWGAFLALKDSFLEKYKNDAYTLNEQSPSFPVVHANITGKGMGIIEFIKFIEEATNKLEDKFVDQVREEQINEISKKK